jgi:hypothetical protein
MTTSIEPSASSFQDLLLFLLRLEAGQRLDADRVVGHPLAEALVVLLGEHGGGDEDRDLRLATAERKGGAHRQLGLAVAHVAADEPVHRLGRAHVAGDLRRDVELVLGLLVGELRLELALPLAVLGEGAAHLHRAQGLDLDHFLRELLDGDLGPQLRGVPGFAAQRRERRRALGAADVLLDEVQVGDRHEEPRAARVLEDHELLHRPLAARRPALPGLRVPLLGGAPLDPDEAADAVGDVDHDVAPLDLEQGVDRPRVGAPRAAAEPVAVEELVVGNEDAVQVLEDEAVVEAAAADLDGPLQNLAQPLFLSLVGAEDDRPAAAHRLELALDVGEDPREALQREDLQVLGLRFRERREREHRVPREDRVGLRPLRVAEVHLGGLPKDDARLLREEIQQRRRAGRALGDEAELQLRDRVDRALRRRIEAAQRLDLVARELDPDRQVRREREEVEDAPADRELAGPLDGGGPLIVRLRQLKRELRQVELAARSEGQARASQDVERRQFAQRGGEVGDQDLDGPVAEAFGLLERLEKHGHDAEAAQILDGLLGGEGACDQQEGGARDRVGQDEGVRGPPHAAGPGGSPWASAMLMRSRAGEGAINLRPGA